MKPGVWWRSLGLCGCVVALLSSGCAHWGWKHASRDKLNQTIDEGEASFVETSKGKPHALASAHSKSTATAAAKPEETKSETKSAPRSAEEEALIDDTLARLRTLPNMKPEQVDAIARDLRNPQQPMPRMALEQINAVAKFKQDEAKRTAIENATATTPAVAAAPVQPAAAAAQPASTSVKPAATAETKPAPAAVTPAAATEPVEPETTEEAPAVEEADEAPLSQPSRSLIDRMRRARDQKATPANQGIFGGKVGAHVAPRLDPAMLAVAHVAQKPATELAVSPESEEPIAWDASLAATISALEAELDTGELEAAEAELLAAKLRMLYLLGDRKEDALAEIEGMEPAAQDYWRTQLHSLSISLATDGTPVKARRAALALRPLREAVDHLAAQATLDVKNVALCKNVSVWGTYTPFEDYTFKPNQEALLYFELENFTSEDTEKGFATEFLSSYEIFDVTGRRVAEQQFPIAQETCQNRRRDYFIRYHFHVPKSLAKGDYTLQLTVEDQKGHKFGQGSVKFKVSG